MLGIKVEFGRAVAGDPGAVERTLLSTPTIAAIVMANAIRQRVEARAHPAEPFARYDPSGIRLISPRYPNVFGGSLTRGGAFLFTSSVQFHALQGTRPGSFSVAGGMWDGYSAVASGPGRAKDAFRGRSEGQDPNFRNLKAGKKARGLRVSNALKAASILKSLGINVLALTEDELEQLALGAMGRLQAAATAELVAHIKWVGAQPGGDIARALIERLS